MALTAGELIEQLELVASDTRVVISRDAEGRRTSAVSSLSVGVLLDDHEFDFRADSPDERPEGINEYSAGGDGAVCLWLDD